MYKQPNSGNARGLGQSTQKDFFRQVKLIGEEPVNQSQLASQWSSDEENTVLHLHGNGVPPFIRKGKINNETFSTVMDTGTPASIFNT